ncbi:MAG: serine/threonine protein phosphatase, partial [Bacteriovoracaceae bacterium]|nr:serine/threonine protein phosphatase [Bacteriovoracaceae bacterium]
MRTLIFTDIHGCADEFKILLEHLQLQTGDQFIFLGDYIDRGPAIREVIELILQLRQDYPVTTLLGNHEQMFLAFLAAPYSSLGKTFLFNGGIATLANYLAEDPATLDAKMQKPSTSEAAAAALQQAIGPQHRQFLAELQLFTQNEHYFFAHAGAPAVDLDNFNPQDH